MKDNHKVISIIVPVYNSEKYLERCILSILNQTLKGLELILINDGSKDTSQEIINKYKEKFPDIIKSKTIKNSGASVARNVGLNMAAGDYIGFVDSDDYIESTMYEKLYKKAIKEEADIVVCGYFTENEKNIKMYQTGYLEQYEKSIIENPNIFVCGVPYLWNKIFKRDLITKNSIYFNKNFRIFEDLVLVYELYVHAKKISKVGEALYYYVKENDKSLTSNFSDKFFDIFAAIKELRDYYKSIGIYDELEDYLIYIALNHAYIRCNMRVDFKQFKIKFKYINQFFSYMNKEFPEWKQHELYFKRNKKNKAKYISRLHWKLKTISEITKIDNFIKTLKKIKKKIKRYNPIGYQYFKYYHKYPVNDNTILIDSQHGNDINGNMFYLIKELNNIEYKNYDIYLGVNKNRIDEFKEKLRFYNLDRVKLVLNGTKKYVKLLATAKFLITDTSFIANYIKKEGQIYLNTWHGTPLKTLGRGTNNDFYNIPNLQKNFAVADYLLYPNEYTMNHMLEDYMLNDIAKGRVLLCGYPRNSIFLDNERRKALKSELKLENKEVIAYMPTWRGRLGKKDKHDYSEQLKKYLDYIEKNLSENQILYINLHPYVKNCIDLEGYTKIVNFPKQYETYDFLNICDILITDYSSVFFDFALTNKKIILFTYDEEKYLAERGLYIGLEKLPFPKVDNAEELIKEINSKKSYNYKEFLNEFCKYDEQNVSKKICEKLILEKNVKLKEIEIPRNKKKNVLILMKNFSDKTINRRFFELLNNTKEYKYNYYIGYINRIMRKHSYNLLKLPGDIKYMGQLYSMCNISFFTKMRIAFHNRLGLKINFNRKKYNIILKDELKRIYGNIDFDYVVILGEEKEIRIRLFSKFEGSFKILYNCGQNNLQDYKNDYDIILTEQDLNSFKTLNDIIEGRKK